MSHPAHQPPAPGVATPRALLAVAVTVTAAKLAWGASVGLLEDEAYYWTWSLHLDWGYFDHPPAIAWLIASTAWVGHSELAVRLGPVLAGLVGWLALVPHAEDRYLFTLLWLGLPVLAGLTLFATPDAPLLAAWAVALSAALHGGRGWLVAGVAVGLGALAKLTGWLLLPLLWLASEPSDERDPRRWWGALLAVVVVLPNVVWNWRSAGGSARFQLEHGLISAAPPGLLGSLDVLLGFVAVGGGLISLAGIQWWLLERRADRLVRFCWYTSLPVFLAFLLAGSQAPGEANWTAPAFVGLALGLSTTESSTALGRLVRSGAWVSAAATSIVALQAFSAVLHLPTDPAARLTVGPVLARPVAAWSLPAGASMGARPLGPHRPVWTERHQEAALIHYYTGIPAHAHPSCGRPNEYDRWPLPLGEAPLFVRPYTSGPLTCVGEDWVPTSPHPVLGFDPDGRPVGNWQVFELERAP